MEIRLNASATGPLSTKVFFSDEEAFEVASVIVMGKKDAVLIDAQWTLSSAHRVVAEILDETAQVRAVKAGSCGIVHQHPVVRRHLAGQLIERAQDRVTALRTTGHPANAGLPRMVAVAPAQVVGRDGDHRAADLGVTEQRGERMVEHVATAQHQVLLRDLSAHPQAAARGRNHRPERYAAAHRDFASGSTIW